MHRNNKAFTIMELLVVLAIIGLLSGLIVINLKNTKKRAEQKKAMEFAHTVRVSLGSDLVGEWTFDDSGDLGKDSSGYENNGTNHGASPADGIIRGALSFNGTSDYVNCGNAGNGNYDAMTIEAWIKRTSDTPSGWRTPLHRNDGTSVGSSVFFIGLETGSHQIVSTIGAGSPGPSYMSGETGVIAQLDEWYHIVCSWDGTNGRVYVNGANKKEYALSSANFSNKSATTRIGASGDGVGYLFKGIIDEVRIYDRALTTAEIQKHYAKGAAKYGIALK